MSSLRAQRSLSMLGRNLRQARLARRFAMADLAERAGVSEKTIQRLERGDPGVGIGNLASVLAALGDPTALDRVLRIEEDVVGLSRAIEATPQRGRSFGSRRKEPSTGAPTSAPPDDDEGVGF